MGSVGTVLRIEGKTREPRELEDMYKNINSNFKPGVSYYLEPSGFNNNCAQCAIAFEANMRGEDVEAKPFRFGYLGESDKAGRIDNAFEGADVWDVGRPTRDRVVREIELTLTEDWGEGSRGILQVQSGRIKHVMNVINDGGKVVVIDAQQGKQGTIAQMLTGLPTKNVNLFRTDNLPIKDDYKEWAYRPRR